ncbi:MAG: glycosyl hydrolase, partial [Verrucomicrobiaceae bacterium]
MNTRRSFLSRTASVLCAVSMLPIASHAAEDHFSDWPEGTSPRFIGTRLAERFIGELKRKPTGGIKREIRYQEIITWYGSLTFAKVSGQSNLTKELIERMDPAMKGETHVIPPPDHVDRNVLGALAAEVYLQSGNQRGFEMAKHFADIQWEPTKEIVEKGDEGGKPQAGLGWRFDADAKRYMEEGLSWQTRYWIDDMYMITMAQGQMFLASKDRKYVDRAAKEMVAYLDNLQEPNGLFYHAPDVPFFWGRGNGWMAAGMTELLRILPEDNPDRPRIL